MNSIKFRGARARHLSLALLASSCLFAPAAFAQDAAQTQASVDDDRDPGDIVVTAQRREERLLDTPVSVGVLTGEQLEANGGRSVADALRYVPNVSVGQIGPGTTVISIRGISPAAGVSTTGYYQDDVPFSFIRNSNLPDANAYDIDRVEVLRGPQGTLFGVNALNGVVRIFTADPDLDAYGLKARGRVSGTDDASDANFAVDGAVNIPLIPGKLAIRAVADYATYGGFIDSTSPARPGRGVNSYENTNYRFKLRFMPTDSLDILAGYQHNVVRADGNDLALDNRTTPFRANQPDTRTLDVYNLRANYNLGGVSITSSTAYLTFDQNKLEQFAFLDNLTTTNNLDSFSQEVRIASDGAGDWNWQVGGYYRRAKESWYQAAPTLPGGLLYTSVSKSYAVFGDITRRFFDDRLQIEGGLRYFEDTVTLDQQGRFGPGPLLTGKETKYDRLTGRAIISFKPTPATTFYASYSTGFRSGLQQTPTTLLANPTLLDAEPDTTKTYEVGAKGQIFGNVLTFETAVFHTEWKGIQQTLRIFVPSVGTVASAVVNAGVASGWGAEAGITLRPVRGLSFNAGLGYNGLAFDADVTQLAGDPPAQTVTFRKGDRPNGSPEWTVTVGADYRGNVSGNTDFYAGIDYSYTSELAIQSLSNTTITRTVSDKIDIMTARAGFDFGKVTVGIFGDNLLNERGALSGRDPGNALIAPRLRPRTIGVEANIKF